MRTLVPLATVAQRGRLVVAAVTQGRVAQLEAGGDHGPLHRAERPRQLRERVATLSEERLAQLQQHAEVLTWRARREGHRVGAADAVRRGRDGTRWKREVVEAGEGLRVAHGVGGTQLRLGVHLGGGSGHDVQLEIQRVGVHQARHELGHDVAVGVVRAPVELEARPARAQLLREPRELAAQREATEVTCDHA
jgi:hypothetical protein